MLEPLIAAEDLTYADEYDEMREVSYRGQPFTGTAELVNEWRRETIEYVDGQAHGRHVVHLTDGTRTREARFAAGECTELRAWYPDGTPQETYQSADEETTKWTLAGVLAYRSARDAAGQNHARWFYPSGAVRQHYRPEATDYFAPDGRHAMRVTYGGPKRSSVRYEPAVLEAHYRDLLADYPLEAPHEKTNVEWYFFGWVWQLLKQNKPAAEAILRDLRDRGATGAHTATLILAKLPSLDLATFEPAMSYDIEP